MSRAWLWPECWWIFSSGSFRWLWAYFCKCVWDKRVNMNWGVLAMTFPLTSLPGFRGFLRPPLVGMLMVIGLCGDGHRQASGREKGARMWGSVYRVWRDWGPGLIKVMFIHLTHFYWWLILGVRHHTLFWVQEEKYETVLNSRKSQCGVEIDKYILMCEVIEWINEGGPHQLIEALF